MLLPLSCWQGYNIGAIKNYQMDFGSSSQDTSSLISSTKNAERQNLPVPRKHAFSHSHTYRYLANRFTRSFKLIDLKDNF